MLSLIHIFRDWIWRDPERRQALVRQYNEEMNATRPREYDGSHIVFGGMNPVSYTHLDVYKRQPKLHELLRPLSDNDIDRAIQDWNGKIESKHAVVRYMKDLSLIHI